MSSVNSPLFLFTLARLHLFITIITIVVVVMVTVVISLN